MADTPVERRVTRRDFDKIAEFVSDEFARRKRLRQTREAQWREIDRQVRMEPLPKPLQRKGSEWMTQLEVPWQAETLELLSADVRRLLFPTDRLWFSGRSLVNDDLLEVFETSSVIAGSENDVPTQGRQEDIDALVEGVHAHFQGLYDFRGTWDRLNIDALKYGSFAARGRLVRLEKFSNDFRGVLSKKQRVPVLAHVPIKNAYLDDTPSAVHHSGQMVAPAQIFAFRQKLDDLRIAARGSSDPTDEDGGWIASSLKGLEGDERGEVGLLEYEGDLIVPRQRAGSLFFPNVIVTVVQGVADQKAVSRVVRYREREFPFGSYIVQHYHEDQDSAYGTSPLMKGRPVQRAGSEAFSRMLDAAILNVEPPIKYDRDDPTFAAQGGPIIAPREMWPTTGDTEPVEIGSVEQMTNLWLALKQEYQDVTGVNAPRLGQQTKSHQTRFAVDSEIQRGLVRTVDYARATMKGAMRTWLSMEWEMIRKVLPQSLDVYVPKYRGYATVTRGILPETVTYDVEGVATPIEEQARQAQKAGAVNLALQIETAKAQLAQLGRDTGKPLDLEAMQRYVLREGFIDADEFFESAAASQGVSGSAQAGPEVPGAAGGDPGAGAVPLATGVR